MSIHFNPLLNVFTLRDLLQAELLSKVLVEGNKACLGQDASHLNGWRLANLPLACRCEVAARCTGLRRWVPVLAGCGEARQRLASSACCAG